MISYFDLDCKRNLWKLVFMLETLNSESTLIEEWGKETRKAFIVKQWLSIAKCSIDINQNKLKVCHKKFKFFSSKLTGKIFLKKVCQKTYWKFRFIILNRASPTTWTSTSLISVWNLRCFPLILSSLSRQHCQLASSPPSPVEKIKSNLGGPALTSHLTVPDVERLVFFKINLRVQLRADLRGCCSSRQFISNNIREKHRLISVPKKWECNFSTPSPKVGNAIFHSQSRLELWNRLRHSCSYSRSPKSHSRPPLHFTINLRLDLVQLCETQMFKFVLYGNLIFDILEPSSFQKYTTCWVFLALRHMLYLCICVFVFLYLCVWHMWIYFFISLNNPLFKNMRCGIFLAFCDMLYLCICAFDTWDYHFWYPWTILFSKIYHMLGLSGTLWYAIFFVFVYLYLCICAWDIW